MFLMILRLGLSDCSDREHGEQAGGRHENATVHDTSSSELNFACTVVPEGVVICTAPFDSFGMETTDVPVSLFSPRWRQRYAL
jgi:hypothetical protein